MNTNPRRDLALLAFLALALCVPFLGKAFHIDDPLVVWTAQQITLNPLDFYGYSANWYGYTQHMAEINQNPPGAAYLAVPFGLLFGWGEIAMHLPVALLLAALVCGVYLLARQMQAAPVWSALAALFAPGVFVSGGTVMTDLPMTTCWIWAITLWVRGLESKSSLGNGFAALIIAAGALTKFFALSLVPLLLVFTLASGRRAWPRALWLLLPLLVLAAYELHTRYLYGIGHFLASVGYASDYQDAHGLNFPRKVLNALAFLGAGAAPALFLLPCLWRSAPQRLIAALALPVVLGAFMLLWKSGWSPSESGRPLPWWAAVQSAVAIYAGICIAALAAADAWSTRDRWSLLLLLWIGGTLCFGMFLYHFVNIRVLLPALPAVALLCGRRLAADPFVSRNGVAMALALSLVLSLAVAYADLRLANAGRDAAARIVPFTRESGTTWFSGHWGFQHYMQARGAQPIDRAAPGLKDGDTVVTPYNTTNRIEINVPNGEAASEVLELPVCPWVSTMHLDIGAGFYSDIWGPLPFVFGPVPPEKYEILHLRR